MRSNGYAPMLNIISLVTKYKCAVPIIDVIPHACHAFNPLYRRYVNSKIHQIGKVTSLNTRIIIKYFIFVFLSIYAYNEKHEAQGQPVWNEKQTSVIPCRLDCFVVFFFIMDLPLLSICREATSHPHSPALDFHLRLELHEETALHSDQ